jgi:hypothetical protein
MSESQPPSAPTPEPGKPQGKPAAEAQGADPKADTAQSDTAKAGGAGDGTTEKVSNSTDQARMTPGMLFLLTLCAAFFLSGLILVVGDLTWSLLPRVVRLDESQHGQVAAQACNPASQPSPAAPATPPPAGAAPNGASQKNPPPPASKAADNGQKQQPTDSASLGGGDETLLTLGSIIVVLGAVGGVAIAINLKQATTSSIRFQRHLVGLGFTLLTDGMINIVAIAGYASGGVLGQIFSQDVLCNRIPCAILILTCLGMAVEGALFFFCNSLYEKLNSGPDDNQFDVDQFWGGLWFRLGEAVIFTNVLLLYVLIWGNPNSNAVGSANVTTGSIKIYMLPLVSLLCGMFLKPAEVLVYGIMERAFAGFVAMTGTKSDAPPATLTFDAAPLAPADGAAPPKVIEKDADALHLRLLKATGVQAAVWSLRGADPNGTLKVVVTATGPSAQDIIGWAKAQNITLTVAKG